MRVPEFRRYRRWMQGFALFMSGIVVGAAIFAAVAHHNFNQLVVMYKTLQAEHRALEADIRDDEPNRSRQTLIQKITVHVESKPGDLDEVTATQLRQEMQEDLRVLRGQPLDRMIAPGFLQLPVLVRQFLSDRYHTESQEYTVAVQTVVAVRTELAVYVFISKYIPE